MVNPARLVTADDLERMPADDFRYESSAAGPEEPAGALRVEIRPGYSDSQLSGGVMPEPTPRGTTTAIERRLITCR